MLCLFLQQTCIFLFDRINMKCLLMSVANRAVHVQFRAWWMVEAWCRDRTSHRWLALHCIPLFIAYQIQVSRKSCLYMVLDSFSTVCHLIAINNMANVHEVGQTRYRKEHVGIAGQRRRFSFSSWLRGLRRASWATRQRPRNSSVKTSLAYFQLVRKPLVEKIR